MLFVLMNIDKWAAELGFKLSHRPLNISPGRLDWKTQKTALAGLGKKGFEVRTHRTVGNTDREYSCKVIGSQSHMLHRVGVSLHLCSLPQWGFRPAASTYPVWLPKWQPSSRSPHNLPIQTVASNQVQERDESSVHPWLKWGLKAASCGL